MNINIQIDKCDDCKHFDHTRQFTKGGAKPCCGHPMTIIQKGYNCFDRVIPYKTIYSDVFNRNYRVIKSIPSWCPLKNKGKY